MSERTISDPKPQLKRLEQTQISKQLQEKYSEVDLFNIFSPNEMSVRNHGISYYAFAIALLRNTDTPPIEAGNSISYSEDVFIHSINSFIGDCVEYGIMEIVNDDLLSLTLTDPTLCEFERDGFRIEVNRSYYTTYQERMDTTGSIDTKPNGEYAVEGVTAESARSW